MNRLLLLSCSRSKRPNSELLPAYERYDGPAFRLLRRYLKSSTNAPAIKILSAEFGLISHDQYIPHYNRRMTVERAQELQPKVVEELDKIVKVDNSKYPKEVFIYLGKDYLKTLEGSNIFLSRAVLRTASGTPGMRLSSLYSWLYGDPATLHQYALPKRVHNKVRIRGVEIHLTGEKILDAARGAIANGLKKRDCSGSWYVLVNGQQVSPKWLISIVTGLPVSSFHTNEARRVLVQLGIHVRAT
jgi:uncharacterized protein DUF6884